MTLHETNGVALARLMEQDFWCPMWTTNKRYFSKELWLHINPCAHYKFPPPFFLPTLETLDIEVDPNDGFNSIFFLAPPPYADNGNLYPFLLLSTLELRGVLSGTEFRKLLEARSDAGQLSG